MLVASHLGDMDIDQNAVIEYQVDILRDRSYATALGLREDAARILGNVPSAIQDGRVLDALANALMDDPDEKVRSAAATSLAKVIAGPATPAQLVAVSWLVKKAAEDESSTVRDSATAALKTLRALHGGYLPGEQAPVETPSGHVLLPGGQNPWDAGSDPITNFFNSVSDVFGIKPQAPSTPFYMQPVFIVAGLAVAAIGMYYLGKQRKHR